ncbi:MAG TPA: [LysW]-aminoadipate kinase, partial [Acidobacteriota bacterium]|nr:[LysW]-aminoadipate kinase [Acidobacteriota bacterium]
MLVVKIGGAAGIEADHFCEDVANRWRDGEHIVCVHGGSDETSRLAEKLEHPPRFVTSVSGHTSRLTDRQTLEIFLMATSLINRKLVEAFQSRGINAIGLSGLDGRLITARRKEAIRILDQGRQRVIRDDWTGTPEAVNTSLLSMLLNSGYLP